MVSGGANKTPVTFVVGSDAVSQVVLGHIPSRLSAHMQAPAAVKLALAMGSHVAAEVDRLDCVYVCMQARTISTPIGMSAGRALKPNTCWGQMELGAALWWALAPTHPYRLTTEQLHAQTHQPPAPLKTSMPTRPTHMFFMVPWLEVRVVTLCSNCDVYTATGAGQQYHAKLVANICWVQTVQ